MLRSFLLVLLASVSLVASAQINPYQKKFPLVDQYIDSLLKDWNVPGMAIVIVHKDQAIYSKGFGYRDMEKKLPVETTTVFPIASNTKLFTGTLAAMLATEGKLSLDRPARSYMPSLQFYNDDLNASVTLRDMLSHRTGLPRYDGIWVGDTLGRKAAVAKVVYMKPQLGFREGYIYNNMMFAASGAVMEAVTGKSWEELTREKILHPLGMNSTVFTQEDMLRQPNYAVSYFADSAKRLVRYKYLAQSEALGPAGTMRSNIEDMSNWMIAQLNGGRYKGVQVIPEAAIKQTLVPNAIADKEGRWDELSNGLYGLGRQVLMYKGYKITTHTGSIDYYYSNMTLIPSLGLGIFMMHNGEPAGSLRTVMAYPVIDRLLGLSYTPWSQRYKEDYLKAVAIEKRQKDSIDAIQVKGTTPSHPLMAYAGTYYHPIYGYMIIEAKDNGLVLRFRRQVMTLHHFHYDQFRTMEEEVSGQPDHRLHFVTNAKGDIGSFTSRVFGEAEAEFIKK
jgi:CubicO group peptidase (beta-lactamase class C family)